MDKAEFPVFRPSDCEAKHRDFAAFVSDHGKVDFANTLRGVRHSDRLCICELDGKLVGTAALKNPLQSYVRKIALKAGLSPSEMPAKEFGYVAVQPDYQGKGIGKGISQAILSLPEARPGVFATTSSMRMAKILAGEGFKVVGNEYVGCSGETLQIYVRPPVTEHE